MHKQTVFYSSWSWI